MQPIEIYSIPVCPFVQRSKIVLRLKRIPHDVHELDITQPFPSWFVEMNPEERVPVIRHEGKLLNESSVINEYLEDCFPAPRLFSSDPYRKALSRVWIAWCNDTFIPPMYGLLMNQDRAKDAELTEEALATFRQLNAWLTKWNPGGTYAWQDFGMVDVTFAPFFQRYCLNEHYRGFKLPRSSSDYARVARWYDACLEHPVVRETGMSNEKYIQLYYDYSLGYGDGSVPPGRDRSSFAPDGETETSP